MNEIWRLGWTWHPSVVIGFGLWTAAYCLAIGPLHRRLGGEESPGFARQLAFHAGTLIGLIVLVSPLDELGDEYLFSAHMLQHLLLMFCTAPLWLIGLPGWLVPPLIPHPLRRLAATMTSPAAAFFAFAGVMWLWHLPVFYEFALHREAIHVFAHLTFIGGALIGWWPLAGPSTRLLPKPEPALRMIYIFLIALACTAMAAPITFAASSLYPSYAQSPGVLGLTAVADQRLGGLMMWLPTHMILLLALGLTFFEWFGQNESHPADQWVPSASH